MTKLCIHATSRFCNRWPTLVVHHNGKLIHTEIVEKEATINIDLDSYQDKPNTLQVGMKGKMFGKDNVYDTVMEDGFIKEDLQLHLTDVKLDDVSILDLLTKNDFTIELVEGMKVYHKTKFKCFGEMCFNGYYQTEYELPLYNYLTLAKWKKPINADVSYFSNHTMVFHYEEQQKEIDELEEILNEIDEQLGDIRSAVRNT